MVTLPTLICLNSSFITIPAIKSVGPCPRWALFYYHSTNDARIIARSRYENIFRPNLYFTATTPNNKPPPQTISRLKGMFFNFLATTLIHVNPAFFSDHCFHWLLWLGVLLFSIKQQQAVKILNNSWPNKYSEFHQIVS